MELVPLACEDVEDVTKAIVDEGNSLDAIYLDFSKAFADVPQKRPLHKTECHEISG